MIYPDKYIIDFVTWIKDFVSQNPVTASVIVAVIARLAKRYPWIGKVVEKVKSWIPFSRKPAP
ncbi:MAG TPA: hypothetical protein PKY80_10010 [Syntrophales bacterium]|nr:hypothetical protein [Syntrophales bacterium]